jgi:hypothetical protein
MKHSCLTCKNDSRCRKPLVDKLSRANTEQNTIISSQQYDSIKINGGLTHNTVKESIKRVQ